MTSLRIAAGTCCLLLVGTSHAADYFVSTAGDEAQGDGSPDRPFATVERAIHTAGPGDSVVLRGGEYRLSQTLRFPRAGAPGRPITVRAYRDEYAALLGSVRLAGWERHEGSVWKCRAPAVAVKGLYEDGERLTHPRERGKRENPPVSAIQSPGRWTAQDGWVYLWTREGDSPDSHRIEASQHGIVDMNTPWLRLEGVHLFFGQPTGLVISADNCVAERCEVAHVANSVDNAYAAYFSGCSRSTLRDCVVHDSYYWGDHGSNSHLVSCIDCGDQGPNFVEGCEIFNGGLGVGTKGAAREMVVRDCRIYDVINGVVMSGERSSGPGAGKTDCGHYTVWHNRIHDCERGIYFPSGDTHSNLIAGNVIERCSCGVYMRNVGGVADRPLLLNNVFAHCGSAIFAVGGRGGTQTLSLFAERGLRSHHNLFHQNGIDWRNPLTWGTSLDQSFAEIQSFGGYGWEAGSIGAAPILDEWGRAEPGSPTIGKGAPVPLPDYVEAPEAWHIGLGPWRDGEARPDPGLTLSIAGSQDYVAPRGTVRLRAVLANEHSDKPVELRGAAVVTFHFRYANVWYFDRQELWRCRVPLPRPALRPGESLDLSTLEGWTDPTNGDLGSPFHLRADDPDWRAGCRLRATVRLVESAMPTNEAVQRLEHLVRSKEVLAVRAAERSGAR